MFKYIINFLSYERSYRNFTNGECTELLEKLGYCLGYDDDCERLLQDMLWLNLLAVNGSDARKQWVELEGSIMITKYTLKIIVLNLVLTLLFFQLLNLFVNG